MERIQLTRAVLAKPSTVPPDSLAGMLKAAIEKYVVRAECLNCLVVEGESESVGYDGLADQLRHVEVVDCEPVDCGILSLDTEVRLIDVREDTASVVDLPTDSFDIRAEYGDRSDTPPSSRVWPCLLKPGRIFGLTKHMKMHLKDMPADDCHVVGLRAKTLRELKLSEGSWIVISADTMEESYSVKSPGYRTQGLLVPEKYAEAQMADVTSKHFVQVFSVQGFLPSKSQAAKRRGSRSATERSRIVAEEEEGDEEAEVEEESRSLNSDIIYLNPYLYFNMTTDYPAILDDFKVLVENASDVVYKASGGVVAPSRVVPPMAKEVRYMRVFAPNCSSSIDYEELVRSFFKTRRLLNEGDVFCVPLVERTSIYIDAQHHAGNLIYFQVQSIHPHSAGFTTYFVDGTCTFKAESKPTYSYIPVSMDCFLCPPDNECWSCFDPPDMWHDGEPTGLENTVDKIRNLILPSMLQLADSKPLHCNILLTGPVGVGMGTVVKAIARGLNMHLIQADCHEYCCDTAAATETKLRALFSRASQCAPCVLLLSHFEVLGKDRTGLIDEPRIATVVEEKVKELERQCRRWPVIVIAASCNPGAVSVDMHSLFLHEVKMEAPNRHERGDILVSLSSQVPLHNDVSLSELAHQTAGMVLGDLFALYSHATRIAYQRVTKESARSFSVMLGIEGLQCYHEEVICKAGAKVRMCDFEAALSILQSAHSDAIGAPKVPKVSWDDVGGLADAKREILETIQLPLNHPELFARGLRRSGVLLYGPPGSGKTLLAKAVATECSLNFLSVKGPELLNMYVGQSEQNVREVFARARAASPCVIFFDELDSLAPNRGLSGDSGGVMDRVVSQLLTELDGIDKVQDVFVIGATNRPDLVDPALLRPGRFDALVYLGVPDTHKAQLSILSALTRKFSLEESFDLSTFVNSCELNLTGADFYALCSDAMFNAMKRRIREYEKGTKKQDDEEPLVVSENDFMSALKNLQPSVSQEDLKIYEEMRQRMSANRRH